MQKKEQCLTMEALKTKQSDENTRKIVAELAAAIEEDEKENKEKEKEKYTFDFVKDLDVFSAALMLKLFYRHHLH